MSTHKCTDLYYYLNDRPIAYSKKIPVPRESIRLEDLRAALGGGGFVFFERYWFTDWASNEKIYYKTEINSDADLRRYLNQPCPSFSPFPDPGPQACLYVETCEFYNGKSAMQLDEAERDKKDCELTFLKDTTATMIGLFSDDMNTLKLDSAALKAGYARLEADNERIKKTMERFEKLEWMLKASDALRMNVTQETEEEPRQ